MEGHNKYELLTAGMHTICWTQSLCEVYCSVTLTNGEKNSCNQCQLANTTVPTWSWTWLTPHFDNETSYFKSLQEASHRKFKVQLHRVDGEIN